MNQPFDDRRDEYPASDSPAPFNPDQGRPAPGPRGVSLALPRSAPYVTYSLIGVTVFVYILQLASIALLSFDFPAELLKKSNDLIRAGQLWRLFTPALVHADVTHIGFNMYALFSLGSNLERFFGRRRFFLLYVLGALAGNVLSFLFSLSPAVGASTAIFGLLGAEGIFLYQNRRLLGEKAKSAINNIIFIAAFNLFIIGRLSFIDNWGHIGGLIGGLMFTAFAGPLWGVEGIPPALQLVDRREGRDVFTGAIVTAVIFGALAVWGVVR